MHKSWAEKLMIKLQTEQDGGTERQCKVCGKSFVAVGVQNFCNPNCRREASYKDRVAAHQEWKQAGS